MEIQYGLNLSTGCRDVDFKPESNFYSPKAKTSGRNYKVSLNQFIHTINAVFGNGGDYSDVAKELGITNSAVYSRVNKLRETVPTLPKIDNRSSDTAVEAAAILAKLGINQ
jgi:predicted DNA-binding protein (UPF0251 family)